MFLVVVLFFSVTCSALPISEDGVQCFARCSSGADGRNRSADVTGSMSVAEHNRARRLFKRGVRLSTLVDDFCDPLPSILKCSMACPRSRVDAVWMEMIQVLQKECSPSVTEEQQQKFFQSYEELGMKLRDHATRCEERQAENYEAFCKNAACSLLSLDEVKAGYPTDVVTLVSDMTKLTWALPLSDPMLAPEACSALFEPYEA